MTDENQNAEPAGEVTTSPVLNVDAAADIMASWGKPGPEENAEPDTVSTTEKPEEVAQPPATQETAGTEGEKAEPEVEEEVEPSEDDEFNKILFGEDKPETDDADKEADTSAIDWDKVPGEANFRLRDGTVVTAADLKRDWDDLRSVRQTQSQLQQREQQFEAERQRIHQEAQALAQIAPRAIAALQSQLPQITPMPPKSLMNEDYVAYQEQVADHFETKAAYDQKVGEIQQMQRAQQIEQQRLAEAENAQFMQRLQEGQQRLLAEIPALRDEGKRMEFYTRFVETGKSYGFSDQEVMSISDPRLVLLTKDAMAYRAMKEKPPAPARKGPDKAAPVAQPGKRATTAEASAQKRQELLGRAKPGMSIDEAANLLAQLE
jgi:hypothetical protein